VDATATGHWKRALEDAGDRDLFDLRDAVVALTQTDAWREIVALIMAGRDSALKSLTQGPTREHAAYARQIGYIAGLEEAPNVVQAIVDSAAQREERLRKAAVADQQARQGGIS
jgi:hypothetical protein